MSILCSKCGSSEYVKNGYVKEKQRYKCGECGCNFTEGDRRCKHDKQTKYLAVKMYLNNCGFRRISHVLKVPLSTCFVWIKQAGKIVDAMVKDEQEKERVDKIEVLEMDELYTYVKKNRKETQSQGGTATPMSEYGLLWIGTDLKLLRLE